MKNEIIINENIIDIEGIVKESKKENGFMKKIVLGILAVFAVATVGEIEHKKVEAKNNVTHEIIEIIDEKYGDWGYKMKYYNQIDVCEEDGNAIYEVVVTDGNETWSWSEVIELAE